MNLHDHRMISESIFLIAVVMIFLHFFFFLFHFAVVLMLGFFVCIRSALWVLRLHLNFTFLYVIVVFSNLLALRRFQ